MQFLAKAETDLQTAFDDAADDSTNTGGACYSHTTFELRELPAAAERFVETGILSLDIALPHDSIFYGVIFDDVRVFLVGLPIGMPSVTINLVKAGSSTFKDEHGRLRRFTHAETKPAISFSYDSTTCAVGSTSDPRLVGGNMRDIHIVYAPYGTWRLEVVGKQALDALSSVTAVRFEFHVTRSPGTFGGRPVLFTGGGGCTPQLADHACTAVGSTPQPPAPAPAPETAPEGGGAAASRPCTNFVEFQPYSDAVTAACCTGASTCEGGFPSACDEACGAVLLPMRRACGAVLEMIGMAEQVAIGLGRIVALYHRSSTSYHIR